jgi:hypothetical protein
LRCISQALRRTPQYASHREICAALILGFAQRHPLIQEEAAAATTLAPCRKRCPVHCYLLWFPPTLDVPADRADTEFSQRKDYTHEQTQ